MKALLMNRITSLMTGALGFGVLLAALLQPDWNGVSNYMLCAAGLFLVSMILGSGGDDNHGDA